MQSAMDGRRLLPALVTVVAIVLIWSLPDLRSDPADVGLPPVEATRGVVIGSDPDRVPESAEDPGGSNEVLVRVLEGPRAGQELAAFVALPFTQATAADFTVGDEVVVTFTQQPDGPAFVSVAERWRFPVIAVLVLVFAATIVLVGGWQGLRALLALALTIVVVVKMLVPAILEGVPPVPSAIVIAAVITVVTIVLTEGFRRVSLAAILGTMGGLAITGLVSAMVGLGAELSGASAGELFLVQFPSGESLDTRGLLLAAIIIGAVGVLDDMTVTQAVTVEGLAARSEMTRSGLWAGSLRIGRSHVAATVNTLFMAYVGAALPALVFLVVTAEPALLSLNREVLALEVVRTLAGGMGIVLAMPLTTVIAIALARPGSADRPHAAPGPAPFVPHPGPLPEAAAPAGPPGRRPRAHGLRGRGSSRDRTGSPDGGGD